MSTQSDSFDITAEIAIIERAQRETRLFAVEQRRLASEAATPVWTSKLLLWMSALTALTVSLAALAASMAILTQQR